MYITHEFISTKADSSDATLVQPSNWNAIHVISGMPLVAEDYKFIAQTPGGSLSIGANTITLRPVPLGVNGTDMAHYLYISGGVGTAEAVLISGGTAVSGADTGTVVVTCAYVHSGAWTIGSATGGLQEALNISIAAGGGITNGNPSIHINSTVVIHGKVTVPVGCWVNLYGDGNIGSSIQRASDYVNGDLIYVPSGSAPAFSNLTIYNGTGVQATSGAAIHCHTEGFWSNDLTIWNGYLGVDLEGTSESGSVNFRFLSVDGLIPRSGVRLRKGTGPAVPQDTHFIGGSVYVHATSFACFEIQGCDSLKIEGMTLAFGDYAIAMVPNADAGAYIASFIITNNIMDEQTLQAMTLSLTNPGTPFALGIISGNTMNGESHTGSLFGIDIGVFATYAGISEIVIANNTITRYGQWGLGVGPTPANANISIVGNNITNNNTQAVAGQGGIYLNSVDGILIANNTVNGGHTDTAIYGAVSLNRATIVGNRFSGATVSANFFPPTIAVVRDNEGIDNVIPNVASTATLTFPVNPTIKVTGTTGVTAVAGLWAGRSGQFITSDGAITFTAGASIGNTFITTQNVPVHYFFDGTKLYLH